MPCSQDDIVENVIMSEDDSCTFFPIIQTLADGQSNETITAPGGLNQKGSLP
jgi:hypothetical protein